MIASSTSLAPFISAIPSPSVHNVHVGPLTLHLYGLILGIGALAGIWLTEQLVDRLGGAGNKVMGVAVMSVIAGFIGARIYHLLSEPTRYAHHPIDAFKIWNGGLGIYGGVALGAAVGLYLAPRRGVPRGIFADAAACGLVLAQAIGRWGNYVNQELFGKPTDLPWGLRVDSNYLPLGYTKSCCYQPTFLYESLYCALLCVILVALALRWKPRASGIVFPIYLAMYSAGRFFIEGLRIDSAHAWFGLRQNQWVALAIFAVAVAVVLYMHRNAPRATTTRRVNTYG